MLLRCIQRRSLAYEIKSLRSVYRKQKTSVSFASSRDFATKHAFLHVAPCGDYWVGDEIFAAKHLQPGYVKSIPLRHAVDPIEYLEEFDGDTDLLVQDIYDKERLPEAMLAKNQHSDASKRGKEEQ